MADPFRTERSFQHVLFSLDQPASPRWHVLNVHHFLEHLDLQTPDAESYLLELVQRLPDVLKGLDPVGLTPEVLHAVTRRLEQAWDAFPMVHEVEAFPETLETLRIATATLYAYGGDVEAAFDVLASDKQDTPTWLAPLAASESDPLARWASVAREADTRGHPVAEALARIEQAWRDALRGRPDAAVVPVVERSMVDGTLQHQAGGLRRIRVELFGERSMADDVVADVTVFGASGSAEAVTQVPMEAARRLLNDTHPALRRQFYAGRVRFDARYAMHEGRSASLAIGALFYGAVLRKSEQREQYQVAPGVALTGDLDEEGRVLPVDDEGLRTKVVAAFFSWTRSLVVPQSQVAEAEAAVRDLEARYPEGSLDLVGVDHLREVFYDRRLTTYDEVSRTRHLVRKAWKRKFSVGSVALILLLTLAVGRLAYGPLDQNPALGEFTGEVLLVKNEAGQVLEEISVGEATVEQALSAERTRDLEFSAFADIDGDRMNEVIWFESGHRQKGQAESTPSYVYVKSVGDDEPRWAHELSYPLDFPRKPAVVDDNFIPAGLAAGDFDGNGQPEVIVVARHTKYFPALVLKLDGRTGEELGRYLHTGHFFTMKTADLENDGVTEIILGGTNNALDYDAVLVVLDPRYLSGHGPLQGDYGVRGVNSGLERAYVRIPRTMVGEAQRSAGLYPYIEQIEVRRSDRLIVPQIRDGVLRDSTLDRRLNTHVMPAFDFDLHPVSIGTSTPYDQLAENLFAAGRIPRLPDHEYRQEFLRERIRYWDGTAWQTEPTRNQRYVEVVAQAEEHP